MQEPRRGEKEASSLSTLSFSDDASSCGIAGVHFTEKHGKRKASVFPLWCCCEKRMVTSGTKTHPMERRDLPCRRGEAWDRF